MTVLSPSFAGSFVPVMKRGGTRLALLLSALFVIFASQALAQEATIVGTVTDPSGASVANASITITNLETGVSRTVPTSSDGQYVAPDLHIGHYTLKATAAGFKVAEQTGLTLAVGDRQRIDFKLQVGSAQEQVTVEANAVAVQTDSGEVSNLITGQQVTQLATNGRSLFTLFALAPGASSLQGDFINPVPVGGDNTVSINGQRAGHNLQILDGGENLDRGGSSGSVMPSLDSLQEFRNMTSNYSAEYGLSSAATITEVIKSGTKQYHASAWEFDRNDAFDARNYFNPAPNKVAELRFNTYGFNVGGPVDFWKSDHKTFFFYNMEWRALIQGQILNQSVPLASWYPTSAGAVLPTTVGGKPAEIIDPANVPAAIQFANCGGTPAGVTPGQPFPNNTIPSCMISKNAQALLTAGGKYGGIFPLPTSGSNFVGGNNVPTHLREEIARVDHSFTSKFSVFGHWISEQISQGYGTSQWSGDNVPTVGDTFGNPSYSAVVHTTYVISPTLLNEASFNYNGNRINIIPNGLITAPSGFTFNRLFSGPNVDNRIPSINLNGSTGSNYTVNWMPWINKADDYQLRDDVSWTRGAHQFKFGFSWALYKKIQDWFANTQGNFNFNGSFTSPSTCDSTTTQCGLDFADFLLGDGQQYTENAVKSSGHWNNVSWASYFQDNWRVNNRLTLNLGLRWDGVPHTYEANHQSANFYPNLYNPANAAVINTKDGTICTAVGPNCAAATPAAAFGPSPEPILAGLQFYTNGIGIGGVNGIPKNLVDNYWANFGPRLGFAYDLTGQGKTVIRGGYGLMYERIQGNDMYDGATNTPFNASPTLNGASLDNPGLNLSNGSVISATNLPILAVGQTGIALKYPPPRISQYSIGVQQALSSRTVLSVSYVGSLGRHQSYRQEINLPPITSIPTLLGSNAPNINTLYNYSGFGPIRLSYNGANSHYNSLQFDLHGSVRRDLQVQVGYTVSKAVDANTGTGDGGDLNNITNPYAGWRYDIGPSIYDRRNVLFTNFVYDLPFLKHNDNRVLRTVVGGWSLSGIITAESGAPLNIGVNGKNASSVIQNSGNRPNLNGSISYPKTVAAWFSPSSFSAPACVTGPDCYGNLPFGAVRGPGRDDWNLSLFKSFVISENRGSRFELRAESFNTWNHTQFKGDYNNGGISTNYGATDFGQVKAAFDPREFQLGAKLIF
ncbi:MAG TPA: carboxypeptidase regulatory-like domain-containing protein [Candidatus Sulfotelmatobacter sp.]|nr:carboxypeptidase regulatory-like domain-containing protein [Candidatus Sulfotelmatobacter sp.]